MNADVSSVGHDMRNADSTPPRLMVPVQFAGQFPIALSLIPFAQGFILSD
jgi:hypothetical protein